MLQVACVLKSGPLYHPKHVQALRLGVQKHLQHTPYVFVCLTDHPEVEADLILPLKNRWPGWWSKIELFDGRLSGNPVLYFDLDTILTGPLDDMALGHKFTVLRNFYFSRKIGSGLMAWDADLSVIHRQFKMAPVRWMREFKSADRWGDQAFIHRYTPIEPDKWQDLHPGKVVSFKIDCVPAGRVPQGASVVCFHGPPRPWQLDRTQRAWFGMRDAG